MSLKWATGIDGAGHGVARKERGNNNFAVLLAIVTTERDGYFGFAEVILATFLKKTLDR